MTKQEKKIIGEYLAYIREHDALCREKGKEMKEAMLRSDLTFNGRRDGSPVMIPKVYSSETVGRLRQVQETIHGICKKVVRRYLDVPDYRAIFPFDKRLRELITIPPGYDVLLPMARYDIFLNEETGDFKFCEFNADGTSGMIVNHTLDRIYIDNPAHQHVLYRHELRPFELFESWVRSFLDVYRTWNQAKESPHVAIVDFLELGTVNEFKEFARTFQRLGVKCCVCDIRDLRYDGRRLKTPSGFEVDAIYKRACGDEVMKRIDLIPDFIRCVKDGNVFLCSSFSAQIIHNKWIFGALRHEQTLDFLTPEERDFVMRHIPRTEIFATEELKRKVLADKDGYVLKPQDGCGGKGVYIGCICDQANWERLVEKCFSPKYLAQEYVRPWQMQNFDFCFGDGAISEYDNLTGLYSYNGKLAGFHNRLSKAKIIYNSDDEWKLPTYEIVKD